MNFGKIEYSLVFLDSYEANRRDSSRGNFLDVRVFWIKICRTNSFLQCSLTKQKVQDSNLQP